MPLLDNILIRWRLLESDTVAIHCIVATTAIAVPRRLWFQLKCACNHMARRRGSGAERKDGALVGKCMDYVST